jgi:agmatinase
MPDIASFDPNSVGLKSNNIFGLPFPEDEAMLVLLPVPWEVTVSYRPGTACGPQHIFNAAMQVDLFDPDVADGWKKGFHMLPIDGDMQAKSDLLRWYAEELINCMTEGMSIADDDLLNGKLAEVNEGGKAMCDWVYERTKNLLDKGKKVGLIGGDH